MSALQGGDVRRHPKYSAEYSEATWPFRSRRRRRSPAQRGEQPMKWMWSTAIVVAAVSAAVSAQSAGMPKSSKHDTMSTTTYTGCVEAVNHGGTYLLTHIDGDAAMLGDMTMHNDTGKMEKGHMPMDDAK